MFQLHVQIRNLLTPQTLTYTTQAAAVAAYNIVFNRRKNKLTDLTAINDDFNNSLCVDCTEIVAHWLTDIQAALRLNAENQVSMQEYGNQAALRAASKPRVHV